MGEFKLQRLGVVMEPEPGNPQEIEGVMNPAAVRGPDDDCGRDPVLRAGHRRLAARQGDHNDALD